MIRIILISFALVVVVYQLEKLFQKIKITKVDSVKLNKLKRIFDSTDSRELISNAIRYGIEEYKRTRLTESTKSR
jgi:hypothetical protein